jgi:hypothetical protein
VGPLAPVIQNVDGSVGGVSLFVVWAVFLGPLAMIALYGINSYLRIQEDREPAGSVTGQGAGE